MKWYKKHTKKQFEGAVRILLEGIDEQKGFLLLPDELKEAVEEVLGKKFCTEHPEQTSNFLSTVYMLKLQNMEYQREAFKTITGHYPSIE